MTGTTPEKASHRIRSLSVVGGFMDGLNIEFAPGLNCIIGARGTGKTTVIEFIRYALAAMPDDDAACKRIRGLVERNLDFGRVELRIETKDGMSYVVTRTVGEDPIVLTGEKKPTEVTLKAGSLFSADIFSQNEVESTADRATSQLDLIDNFEVRRIAELSAEIRRTGVDMSANASGIAPIDAKLAALDEELAELPGVEEKLKGMATAAGSNAQGINLAHAAKVLRDRERRALDATAQALADHHRFLGEQMGVVEREAARQFSKEILGGPNKDVLAEIRQSLSACAREVDAHLKRAQERVVAEHVRVDGQKGKLASAHAAQEMAFRTLIEKHQEAMGKATERSQVEKRRSELLAKKLEHQECAERRAKLLTERTTLLGKLSELRDQRFKVRRDVADRINQTLVPNIRVTLTQDGNPERYLALIEELLSGGRLKQRVVAQKIVNALWPADVVSIARTGSASELVSKAELNADQAQKVVATLRASRRLHELETVELLDNPKIELNDCGTYKDSQALSTGQKCTTILPILLMESEKPLLVDQPEDNLDNRFISQTVVESLRKVKARRQLIFVTHNPNIPVLGDAAQVFVFDSNGKTARLAKHGTVDECKDEIVTLLEGGEDAFRARKERYKY